MVQLKVKKVTPKGASTKVKWKSSKKKVATVSSTGLVKAKKKGTAKIIATSKTNKKVKAVCKIKVKNGTPNKSITLNSSMAVLTIGQSATLKVTKWNPSKTSVKKVTWSSSKSTVATVKSNGVVTAVGAGNAVITATNTYGKKASCRVTVNAPVTPTQNPPVQSATPSPEASATPSPEASATPSPEASATPSPEASATPSPEASATPSPEVSATPSPTASATTEPTAVPAGDVSVAVTSEDNIAKQGVSVSLISGSQTIENKTTDAQGIVAFTDISYGVYTLVAEFENQKISKAVMVTLPSTEISVQLLGEGKNTAIEIKGEEPLNVAVDGLSTLFETENIATDASAGITQADLDVIAQGGSVEIQFAVEKKLETEVTEDYTKIVEALDNETQQVGMLFDFSVSKSITPASGTSASTSLNSLPENIEIVVEIPEEFREKNLSIIRVHDGVASALSQNSGEEYYTISGDYLKLYVRSFSTYALVCDDSTLPEYEKINGIVNGSNTVYSIPSGKNYKVIAQNAEESRVEAREFTWAQIETHLNRISDFSQVVKQYNRFINPDNETYSPQIAGFPEIQVDVCELSGSTRTVTISGTNTRFDGNYAVTVNKEGNVYSATMFQESTGMISSVKMYESADQSEVITEIVKNKNTTNEFKVLITAKADKSYLKVESTYWNKNDNYATEAEIAKDGDDYNVTIATVNVEKYDISIYIKK